MATWQPQELPVNFINTNSGLYKMYAFEKDTYVERKIYNRYQSKTQLHILKNISDAEKLDTYKNVILTKETMLETEQNQNQKQKIMQAVELKNIKSKKVTKLHIARKILKIEQIPPRIQT